MIHRIDSLLDQCYGKVDNPDKQLEITLRARGDYPGWLPAFFRLPSVYRAANQRDQALKAIEDIKTMAGGVLPPSMVLSLARLQMQREMYKPVESRKWDAINAALDSVKPADPEESAARVILKAEVGHLEAEQLAALGDTAESQKKYGDIVAMLDEATTSSPKNAELWSARASLELVLPFPEGRSAEDRIKDAENILEKAHKEIGDDLRLRLAAVNIAARLPLADALRELSALENPPFPAEEQPQFLKGLAAAYAALADRSTDDAQKKASQKRAMGFFNQAAQMQKANIAEQIFLAEAGDQLEDASAIDQAIGRVEKVEGPNGPNGNYLKALKLLAGVKTAESTTESEDEKQPLSDQDKQALTQAQSLLRQAKKDRAAWAKLRRALGSVEWRLGDQTAAAEEYDKAFDLGDRTPAVIDRLLEYYTFHQGSKSADELLQSVALDRPRLLGDPLVKAYNAMSDRSEDEFLIFLSLWRSARGVRGKEVLDPLTKASELAPQKRGPWLALVEYYVRAGQPEKAKSAIADAQKKIVTNPPYRKPQTLAVCFERVGDRQAAERYYREALKLGGGDSKLKADLQTQLIAFYLRSPKTDPEQQKADFQVARQMLDELLDDTGTPQSLRQQALRIKAQLMASGGTYADTELALEFLTKNRPQENVSVDDLRAEDRILLSRNRYQDRLAVIKILETLASRNELSLQEKVLLARTYEQTKKWQMAKPLYQEILQSTDDVAIRARYTSSLIAHHDLDEAQPLLDQLKKLQKDSFGIVLLDATFQQAKGDVNAAVRLVQQGIENLADVDSPDQAVADLVLAGKLEEALDSLETHAREKNDRESLAALGKVRQLLTDGNPHQAAEMLKRQLAALGLQFGFYVFQLKGAAGILDGWGQLAPAEATIRQMLEISERPEDALMLISNVARQGRIEEALALCRKAWETCPAESVGRVCVAVLRTGKASKSQIGLAEAQLLAAIDKSPDSLALQMHLADLRDFQGRYDEAQQIYEAVLMKNPYHVTALNNLAWLIAMRGQNPGLAVKYIDFAVNQADKLVGPLSELLDTLAVVNLRAGKNREALVDMKKAAELAAEPGPMLYFHLAEAQLANGQTHDANRTFEKAKSLTEEDFHPLEAPTFRKVAKALRGFPQK